MYKTFLKGLAFGAGFSLSAVIASVFYFNYIHGLEFISSTPKIVSNINWHELSDEQQIRKATALAVARYSKSNDGSKIATITEIYKKNEFIDLKLEVGDPYPDLKYYPRKGISRTGAVIFFTSSPAEYRHALYLYDDRVSSFGGMPLNILIKKFKAPEQKKSTSRKPLRDKPDLNDKINAKIPFHKLKVDELIKRSNIIAMAEYQKLPSGEYTAIFKQFLKISPNTEIYYKVGDEYAGGEHSAEEHEMYGDGLIVFFEGWPSKNNLSLPFANGQIQDMSLDDFIKKCKI